MQRAGLDVGLLAGPDAQLAQRALVLGGGDRQVAGEAAPMASGELAGVEADRDELALGGTDLDPAAARRPKKRGSIE